ncbi:unnamed protein product [Urochloa humidicola]
MGMGMKLLDRVSPHLNLAKRDQRIFLPSFCACSHGFCILAASRLVVVFTFAINHLDLACTVTVVISTVLGNNPSPVILAAEGGENPAGIHQSRVAFAGRPRRKATSRGDDDRIITGPGYFPAGGTALKLPWRAGVPAPTNLHTLSA